MPHLPTAEALGGWAGYAGIEIRGEGRVLRWIDCSVDVWSCKQDGIEPDYAQQLEDMRGWLDYHKVVAGLAGSAEESNENGDAAGVDSLYLGEIEGD